MPAASYHEGPGSRCRDEPILQTLAVQGFPDELEREPRWFTMARLPSDQVVKHGLYQSKSSDVNRVFGRSGRTGTGETEAEGKSQGGRLLRIGADA